MCVNVLQRWILLSLCIALGLALGGCITPVVEAAVNALVPLPQHTVEVGIPGSGTVTRTPEAETYPLGSEVSLLATPDEGWLFAGWTGDVDWSDDLLGGSSTANPVMVTVDADQLIIAVFVAQPRDGYWSGTVGESGAIGFRVGDAGKTVSDFSVTCRDYASALSIAYVTTRWDESERVFLDRALGSLSASSMSFVAGSSTSSTRISIVGNFDSPTQAAGDVSIYPEDYSPLGGLPQYWTATWNRPG